MQGTPRTSRTHFRSKRPGKRGLHWKDSTYPRSLITTSGGHIRQRPLQAPNKRLTQPCPTCTYLVGTESQSRNLSHPLLLDGSPEVPPPDHGTENPSGLLMAIPKRHIWLGQRDNTSKFRQETKTLNTRSTTTKGFRRKKLIVHQNTDGPSGGYLKTTPTPRRNPQETCFQWVQLKTHWPPTEVVGPSGGHLVRHRGLDGSSGGPVSSGFSQNALAVHNSGWTFWRLSSKKPRPRRFFRGTCFQWVQSKRTGCPRQWMDLLAAI